MKKRSAGGFVALDEERRELVTAHPSREIRAAQRVAEQLGDVPEHPVTLRVAQRVVDLLEVVEVEEDERHSVLVPA